MSLYQKGLLAFALVILIAVGTVSLLVGRQTETELRHYAALYSNKTQNLAVDLSRYYAEHGSWEGLPAALPALAQTTPQHGNQGASSGGRGRPPDNFQVLDTEGNVIARLDGDPQGRVSASELARALPLVSGEEIVGYLLPEQTSASAVALGEPEQRFLERLRAALAVGALAAFVAALLVGGLLMRGIVAPVRRLTQAAENIATGDLRARAPVGGRDEIGRLGRAFNSMAESLERSQDARRAQTADIAHELRNPLAVLQGTLEAIADGVYEPTPENIAPGLDQVRTLNRLVEDLRLLALADAGELRLERHPLDLAALLQRVGEAHRARLEEQGLSFACELPATLPPVSVDADRLAQVLGNILDNAARYVPPGGRVLLTAAPHAGGLLVRVADDGPGVPADELPHVFERFWRGESSRNRATGGSGLGLAIARRIIEAHEGRIWAEPTPGGGLTLACWLMESEER